MLEESSAHLPDFRRDLLHRGELESREVDSSHDDGAFGQDLYIRERGESDCLSWIWRVRLVQRIQIQLVARRVDMALASYIRSGLEHKLRGVPCTINRFPSSGSNGRKALKWTWKREEELEMRSKVVGFMGKNAGCVLRNYWNGNQPRSEYGYGRNSLCESG